MFPLFGSDIRFGAGDETCSKYFVQHVLSCISNRTTVQHHTSMFCQHDNYHHVNMLRLEVIFFYENS